MNSHNGISLYYVPSDGKQWACYLQGKLDSKEYSVATELNDIRDDQFQTKSTRVNVFLLTPDCLTVKKWDWVHRFDIPTSIAVLAGINHEDLAKVATKRKASEVLEWLTYEVEANDDSVRTLLVTILSVYEREHELSSSPRKTLYPNDEDDYMKPDPKELEEDSQGDFRHYDYLPSKKRQVNRLHDVLGQPPNRENLIYVILDRKHDDDVEANIVLDTGEMQVLKHLKEKAVYTFLRPEDPGIKEFEVMLGEEVVGFAALPPVYRPRNNHHRHGTTIFDLELEEDQEETPLLPPKKHKEPNNSTTESVQSNQDSQLDKLKNLLSELMEPRKMLCHCLGVDNDSQLDSKMAAIAQFPSLPLPEESLNTDTEQSDSKWPTYLHFGAEMNLENFCKTLLQQSWMRSACRIRNVDGLCPAELARNAGHMKLAEVLENVTTTSSTAETQVEKRKVAHDSGYLGGSTVSTLSQDPQEPIPEDRPEDDQAAAPQPHIIQQHMYFDMQGNRDTNNRDPQDNISKPPHPKPRISLIKDSGLGQSIEEDEISVPTNIPEDKDQEDYQEETETPVADVAEPFGNLMEIKGNADEPSQRLTEVQKLGSQSETVSLASTGSSDSTLNGESRNTMGSESTGNTGADKKQSGFFSKLFPHKKKKTRSASEPGIGLAEFQAIQRKHPQKKYVRKHSQSQSSSRSSDVSTTNSSCSDSSSVRISDELKEHVKQKSTATKEKSKKKIGFFMKNVGRRKSLRLSRAIGAKNLSPPSIPLKNGEDETF